MHTFIPLLGNVHTEQSEQNVPNTANLGLMPRHKSWLKKRGSTSQMLTFFEEDAFIFLNFFINQLKF